MRDHGLKIGSVSFVDLEGKKHGSRMAGAPLFARATASSGCPHVADTIRVKTYLNDDADKFAWDTLRETGANTLDFRSDLPGLKGLISKATLSEVKKITIFD